MPKTKTKTFLAAMLIAALPVAAMAAASHDHGATPPGLTFEAGKVLPTDASLRTAMSDIRASMASALKGIHTKTLAQSQYQSLAASIQSRVDFIVANCTLPEDADARLHPVLEQIIEGADEMKGGAGEAGAVKIVQALDAYGAHFDHPGWVPLAE